MAIDGFLISEKDLNYSYRRLGRVTPGNFTSMVIRPTGEMLGIKCYGAIEGGEVFSYPEPPAAWLDSGLPAEALLEENLEACIWPGQPYKRRIAAEGATELLILQCVNVAEVPLAEPAEASGD